jgi:CheY-like chemotaxis protein
MNVNDKRATGCVGSDGDMEICEQGSITTFDASVLVAEDNPINQEVAKMMLEVMGCRVDQAESGLQAVDMALKNPYNLILMDCQMPDMDGFSATEIIRSHERDGNGTMNGRQRVAIIAMTGNTTDEDRSVCLNRGMDDFLRKPFTIEEMSEILKRWLPMEVTMEAPQEPEESIVYDASIIDQRYLDNIRALQREGAPDILAKVLDNYFTESPVAIEKLTIAVENDNREDIRAIAHRFKSGSGNLGAIRLAEICHEMEKGAPSNIRIDNLLLLEGLKKEFEAVIQVLFTVRQGNKV